MSRVEMRSRGWVEGVDEGLLIDDDNDGLVVEASGWGRLERSCYGGDIWWVGVGGFLFR